MVEVSGVFARTRLIYQFAKIIGWYVLVSAYMFSVMCRYLKESYYAFPSFLTYKCCYVRYSCSTMLRRHVMKYMHLELSSAHCIVTNCVVTLISMCAGLPYMGMPALCTQSCACCLPPSAQTPLHSALCLRDYSTLVEMAPIKCFCFFFRWLKES